MRSVGGAEIIDEDPDRAYGRGVTPAPMAAQPQPPRRRSTDLSDLTEPIEIVARPLRVAPEPGAPGDDKRGSDPGVASRRSLLGEWPIAIVVAGLATGMLVVAMGHFRAGAVTMAGATLMALFLRVLLPTREVGLLAVRSRLVDVLVLATLAFSLALFAFWVPTPG